MGKHHRKMQTKLDARVKACVEARAMAVKRNPKLSGCIEKAWKIPGSRKLSS